MARRRVAAGDPPGGRAAADLNALGMVAGRVASMALGFGFWLLAARLFPARTVGLAAGAVSLMMLCTQLSALGLGSAFIARLPAHRGEPGRLLDVALTAVAGASGAVALVFLLGGAAVLDDLGPTLASPSFGVLFVAATVLGTSNIVLDQVSIAFGRGQQVLVRNVAFGVVAVAGLALAAFATGPGAGGVFAPWAAAGMTACAVGWAQIRRTIPGHHVRPRRDGPLARELLRAGGPNHLLTLTERLPALVLPVVVTELLSPAANAHWYAAWMMAWVVAIIPLSVGMSLFAVTADPDADVAAAISRSVRTSLGVGVVAALGLAVLGPLALRLLGSGYAAAGAGPLRILVWTVLPMTFIQVHFAVCRGRGRIREAIATGAVSGAAGVALAALAARPFGLAGMAAAWVGVSAATALWCAVRTAALRAAAPAAPAAPRDA